MPFLMRLLPMIVRRNLISPRCNIPLKTSLIPDKAVDGTPTFTRASAATVIDFEGLIKTVRSGEARFHGARRVENLFLNSEDFSQSNWLAFLGSKVGPATIDGIPCYEFSHAADSSSALYQQTVPTKVGGAVAMRALVRAKTGTATLRLGLSGNPTDFSPNISVGTTWTWIAFTKANVVSANNAAIRNGSDAAVRNFYVAKMQIEDATGQSNTNPAEYVSTNVLSAPYHGAGVDGVKYFNYQNGNTVSSNVITEAKGAPISDSTLRGYLAEEQRINLVLQSQNHATTWTAVGTPTITSSNKVYGNLALDLLGDNDAAAVEGYKQNITFTGDAQKSVSVHVKKGTSAKSTIRLRDTTAGTNRLNVEITWSGTTPVATYITGSEERPMKALADGTYRLFMLTSSVTAANTNSLEIYPAADNTLSTAETGDINIGGWQAENAVIASSYILTTTATATRNADVLNYDASNINNTSGIVTAEIQTNWQGSPPVVSYLIGKGSGSDGGLGISTSDTASSVRVHDGTGGTVRSGLNDASTAIRKRGCMWGTQGRWAGGDGIVSASPGSFDGDMGFSSINIGHINNARFLMGTIRNIKIYNKEMSSDKFKQLVT